jgi:hypothetical protein
MQTDPVGFVEIDVGVPNVSGFLNASAGIVKEHQERTVSQCQVAVFGEGLKQRIDFIAFQVDGFRSLDSFRRNGFHSLGFGQHLWMMNSQVAVECAQGSKPLISRTRLISALFLNRAQKIQHPLKGKIVEGQPCDGSATQGGNMNEKELNRVAVASDRTWTEPLLDLQVVFEKGEHNLAEAGVH